MMKFLIFAFLVGCVTALTTPCRNCNTVKGPKGANAPTPTGTCKTVSIEPCTQQPCELKKGTNITFSVQFTANAAATTLTSEVYGVINGVPVKFNLPNPNGCKESGITCPLVAGETYTYKDALYISHLYPAINLVVKWSLLDQAGSPIFCVVAPAKITS
ncbi:putative Epididymal secretory protein E1 [Hypsibius exemplaris]|uniref:Epididymal secretory protein E1 n=1 Tax=Hypsibius exemplaris TaxID=2072580 RepID=A0A1W0WU27_HYPEX|nr:putative Epididymal secretory protein E1 [Hypsibius exemplaris]